MIQTALFNLKSLLSLFRFSAKITSLVTDAVSQVNLFFADREQPASRLLFSFWEYKGLHILSLLSNEIAKES